LNTLFSLNSFPNHLTCFHDIIQTLSYKYIKNIQHEYKFSNQNMKNQALLTLCGKSCYCDYKPKWCNHIKKRLPNPKPKFFFPPKHYVYYALPCWCLLQRQDKDKTSKIQKYLINKEFNNEQELNGFIAWTMHNTNYTLDELEIQSHNLCWWDWRVMPS